MNHEVSIPRDKAVPRADKGKEECEGVAASSLSSNLVQRRRRDMLIDLGIKPHGSSLGAAWAGNQASMPLLRSFGHLNDGFYQHVAPTALRLEPRTRRYFNTLLESRGDLSAALKRVWRAVSPDIVHRIFFFQERDSRSEPLIAHSPTVFAM